MQSSEPPFPRSYSVLSRLPAARWHGPTALWLSYVRLAELVRGLSEAADAEARRKCGHDERACGQGRTCSRVEEEVVASRHDHASRTIVMATMSEKPMCMLGTAAYGL
jgi:hypothetical protein